MIAPRGAKVKLIAKLPAAVSDRSETALASLGLGGRGKSTR